MAIKKDIRLTATRKSQIATYAALTPQGQELLLKQLYNSIKQQVLNFFRQNKTKTCYVHFTFFDGKPLPTIIIDNNPNSNSEMFCVQYTKFVDF